jgi:hypothetical protein
MYDILIPVAEKDFVKLRFVWESIINNLDGFDKIHCISNVKIPLIMRLPSVEYYTDADIVNFDFLRFTGTIKGHEGWYIQQYIKLFQKVTSDDYLEVDADVFFNRKVDIIENGKPSFLFGRDQHHLPYFNLMKKVFDLDRVYPHSFINETMFFKRSIINHFLDSFKIDPLCFFERILHEVNRVNEMSGFSEYEFYGNWATRYFEDSYNYKHLKTKLGGMNRNWSESEVRNYVNYYKGSDYDLISMHSWIQ